MPHGGRTRRISSTHLEALPESVRLTVATGPEKGRSIEIGEKPMSVGSDSSCDLVLTDPHVSRRHLELRVQAHAVEVRDLGSTNGSFHGGVKFDRIEAVPPTSLTVGDTELRIVSGVVEAAQPAWFGGLLAASKSMRSLFAVAGRVARTDMAVLMEGETGTGKEILARGIHDASKRAERPFVICDLSALPKSLIESALFGHVRGAFTGADRERRGYFAEANGGTVFLDEIGELDLDLQPRLLRALEARQVTPVGKTVPETVDVRVIAATNRDLEEEVKAGRFRRDLYHRLAVVRLALPPLRDRPEDIPVLVEHFLEEAAGKSGGKVPSVSPATMAALRRHDWPGNVRELRHVIERALFLAADSAVLDAAVLGLDAVTTAAAGSGDMTFREAKERLVEAWEREYVQSALASAGGNISEAARRAGMGRATLHRLLKKHGLEGEAP